MKKTVKIEVKLIKKPRIEIVQKKQIVQKKPLMNKKRLARERTFLQITFSQSTLKLERKIIQATKALIFSLYFSATILDFKNHESV